jgi:hypothetical protein
MESCELNWISERNLGEVKPKRANKLITKEGGVWETETT